MKRGVELSGGNEFISRFINAPRALASYLEFGSLATSNDKAFDCGEY